MLNFQCSGSAKASIGPIRYAQGKHRHIVALAHRHIGLTFGACKFLIAGE
jgi:hypothetical protein